MSAAALRDVLDQLATCANMVCTAVREEDQIKFHYGLQGMEFEVMRAAWLLGEQDEARRIHALVGDHSPDACPVCVGDDAYGADVVEVESMTGQVDRIPLRGER